MPRATVRGRSHPSRLAAEKIQKLLARIYERLPKNGALLIAEKLLDEDKQGPGWAHLQSLNMLVCAEGKDDAERIRGAAQGGRVRGDPRAPYEQSAGRRARPEELEERKEMNLYERLGGVYAIAAVVDDFVDRIMGDPRLNANPKVNEAHHKVAPAGFKYLVTEQVCEATGGAQRHGRSMLIPRPLGNHGAAVAGVPRRFQTDARQVHGAAV